jgi:hypothetical protein
MRFTFNRFDPAKPIRFCTTADDPGAGGGGGGDDKPKPKRKPKDVDLAVESAWVDAVAEHGSEAAAGKYFLQRNYSNQTAKDKAETELNALKAQKPDESAQQLTESERAELTAYRELGKADELKKELETGRVAVKEKDLEAVAKALNLKPNALFKSLLGNVEFEMEGDGEDRKVKSVKVGDKALSFDDYAKTRPELTEALPLLQEGQQQQRGVTRLGKGPAASSGGATKTVWDDIRAQKKAEAPSGEQKPWQEQVGARPIN